MARGRLTVWLMVPVDPAARAHCGQMEKHDRIDAFGATMLTGFSLLLAFNQVVIKVTTGGLQPVFFAGLRSAGAVLCLYLWLKWRRVPLDWGDRPARRAGLLIGAIFAAEFLCLFTALDLTTVGRTSVLFYSMPIWMAVGRASSGARRSADSAPGGGIGPVGVGRGLGDAGARVRRGQPRR